MGVRAVVAVLLAAMSLPLRAQDVKTLDWPAFSVEAHLDSTGTLHVRERQTILFNGDWNGGERRFDRRDGQRFVFRRLLRVDSVTGAEIPMRDGSLDIMDGYRFRKGTVRWRSRLPDAPVFVNTKITYVLEYDYADILVQEGQTYRLDHEFGFRDRTGTIANFDLTLRVDPSWRTPDGFTGKFRQQVLEPGIGYVVNIPLVWQASGVPSAVRRSPPLTQRLGVLVALVGAIAVMMIGFLRAEMIVGRFAPVMPPEQIDRAWLHARVRSHKAEVVGYAWDERVGAAEVSATLARMVQEKKLGSRVESDGSRDGEPVLHLELLVPRGQLEGYELLLVDAFFSRGKTTTSTDRLRDRYKSSGFDPASILEEPLIAEFSRSFGTTPIASAAQRRWPRTAVFISIGVALLVAAIVTRRTDAEVTFLSIALVGIPTFLVSRLLAAFWQRRVVRPVRHLTWMLVPLLLAVGAMCWGMITGFGMLGLLTQAALAMLTLGAWSSVLNGAQSRSTKPHLLRRKELAAAREFCRLELLKPTPAFDDSWYPHLLAFGLNEQVEKWFTAFGGESATRSRSASGGPVMSTSSSSDGVGGASSGSSDSFSGFGGGGGFSGAGATVGFGSALGAMSSGVSAPSSSSSSGGGSSSSGGSSGGGGGGGW